MNDTVKLALLVGGIAALGYLGVNALTSPSQFVQALADAIAKAEGANPSINNPGDLTGGDVPQAHQTGVFNAAGVVKIDTLQNGWNALFAKLSNIMNGNSAIYSPDMTIDELSVVYTGNDNAAAWASTVASQLGVTTDTTIRQAQQGFQGS